MEKSNVKQRIIHIHATDKVEDTVLFVKDNASPQDIMSVLSLFERDGLKVVIELDSIDISTGSLEHNIK